MPLDPNISLAYQPPQIANPLATIAQVQALKNQQTQGQLSQLQLQQEQRQMAAQQALGAALADNFKVNQDGTSEYDVGKISQKMAAGGFGYALPNVIPSLTAANESAAKYQQTKVALQEAQNDLVGQTAYAVKQHFTAGSLMTGVYGLTKQGVMNSDAANAAIQDIQAHQDDLGYLHQRYDPMIDNAIGKSQKVTAMMSSAQRGEAAMGELGLKKDAAAIAALSSAQNAEDFQKILADQKARGANVSEFEGRPWTPDLQFDLQTRNAPASERAGMANTYAKNQLPTLMQAAQKGPEAWKEALSGLPKPVQAIYSGLGDKPTQADVLHATFTPAEWAREVAPVGAENQFIADFLKRNPGKTIADAVQAYSNVTYHPPIVLVPNAAGGATAQPIRPGATVAPGAQTLSNYTAQQPYMPTTGDTQGLTGEDFLKTLPPASQNTVRQIANGDIPPPPAGSRSPAALALLSAVTQYDHTFNANRYTAMKDFSEGGKSKQVNAINTAIGHLELLDQAGQALKNGTFVPGNALYNRFVATFGAPQQSNVASIIQRVSGELNKATGSIGEGEQEAIKKNLSGDMSPEQLHGAVKTNIGLLGEAMDSLKQDYMRGTNFTADHPKVNALLTPRAKEALTNMGFDPTTMKPSAQGAAPTGIPTGAIIQRSKVTGKFRYSTDGGKTWQTQQ